MVRRSSDLKKQLIYSVGFLVNNRVFRIALVFSVVFLPVTICGQSNQLVKLKHAFFSEESPSARATLLNQLSWACYVSGNDSCTFYGNKALSYALRKKLPEQRIIAQLQLAEYQRCNNRFSEALKMVVKAENDLQINREFTCLPLLLLVKGNFAYEQESLRKARAYYTKGYRLANHYRSALQIDFCFKLAQLEAKRGDFSTERRYLKKGYAHAVKFHQFDQQILVLNNLGTSCAMSQQFDQANAFFSKSLQLSEQCNDLKGQSRAYLNSGNIAYYKGDWVTAVRCYTQSARIKEKLNDVEGIALIHNSIGAVYKEQKRYSKSREYYQKASTYYQQSGDSMALIETWINTAIVDVQAGKKEQAVSLLKKAIRFLETNKALDVMLVAQTNLAYAYTEMGRHQNAIHYLQIAEKAAKKLHDQHSRVFITNLYGANYFFLKDYPKAIGYYKQSYQQGKELGLLNEQKKALYGLYEAEQYLGHYQQALRWHETYLQISDSLMNTDNLMHLTQLEEQYDTKLKIAEIADLHSQNATISLEKKLTSKQLNISLLGIACVLVAVFFLITFFYQRNKRQQMSLIHTKERNKERVDQLLKDHEINTLEMVVVTQETERKRLAKEIHDNLGSYLSTLRYQHEAAKPVGVHPDLLTRYSITAHLIADACSEVRSIAHQLITGADFQFSFIPEIRKLIDRIHSVEQFEVSFHYFPETIQPEREMALMLYKIIQELLSNVLKHAAATKVEITLNLDQQEIRLIVEDNGCGFDLQTASSGIGLTNIRERISQFNGMIELNSTFRKGTSCIIILPLNT
jgi:two-component system, NarL family, sensor kinase